MGNRTRAETITAGATQLTNYTYNIANQLISDGAQSFSYDANGRLISAGDRSYSYALNDRLIALSQPGLSATFAYNGDGVRLAQTENGSETRYLVDTQRNYSEVVGAITPESETWYLLGLDVLGQQQGSDWSYYAYDGLGSVRLALDINGSPRAGMRYEPYGQPAASWGTPPALGFTGEWTDSSGLLYLRARYLDPSSATFLSRDPFEGLPTRALSRNGYSWVEGNPINYVDPSGEFLLASGYLVAAGAVGILLLLSALGQHMNQTRDTMPDLARAMEDAFDDYCLPLSLIPGTGIALGIAQAAAGIAAGGAGARAREQSNARATAQANSTSIAPPMVTAVPDDNDEYVTLYRGSELGGDEETYESTGYIMSDAAREGWQRGYSTIADALQRSMSDHQILVNSYGSEYAYALAHSFDPVELNTRAIALGVRRTFISFTESLERARLFGQTIYWVRVHRAALSNIAIPGSPEEEEWLVRHMIAVARWPEG